MKNVDIVMLALPRWDGHYFSTALSIASELSKKNRVFYVDNPFTIKDVILGFNTASVRTRLVALFMGLKRERRVQQDNPNLINVTPMMVLPINFFPPGRIYNFLSRINNAIVKRSISATLRKYKIKDFIFINSFNPFFLWDIDEFNPRVKVYQTVDNIFESRYISKHGILLEEAMIKKFDFTIATSSKLTEYAKGINENSFLLPNAANFELFQNSLNPEIGRPLEISTIEGKTIIGYIGHLDHRIDYDLLSYLAKERLDYIFLLVGPKSEDFNKSGLGRYPNVITTGAKKLVELPAYLKFMDCTIIPFLCNELTETIYPLKLNEYLTGGKPVVTTDFSMDLKDFKDVISIVNSKEKFLEQIVSLGESFDDKIVAKRITIASTHTWGERVKEFRKILNSFNKGI